MEALLEVACPACGGIVEADTEEEIVELATEHCQIAHGYLIPREHVVAAIKASGES